MTTEMNVEEQQQLVGEFLQGLAQSFGIKANAENVSSDEDSFEVNLAGDDKELGLLIGPKGNHLVAIHEVSKTMLQRRLPGVNRARIRVDVRGSSLVHHTHGAVYCVNHTSNLEPPIIYMALAATHPRLKIVYKAELRTVIPILRTAFDIVLSLIHI